MAYAAVISLQHTLQCLLRSPETLILPQSRQSLEFAYEEARSLQGILQRLEGRSNERVNALNEQIRETIYKLEDALEAHVSNQFLSQSKSLVDEACPHICPHLDLGGVKQDINSFTETVKKMEEECSEQDLAMELKDPFLDEDDDVSSTTDFGGIKSKMVGLYDERRQIRQFITDWGLSELRQFSLVGMPGIGKSTLAKEIYEDALVSYRFKCRAWVRIGPNFNFKEIILCLLGQMNHDTHKIKTEKDEDEKLVAYLRRSLEGKRYFIVLDDIWNKDDWDKLKSLLPDDHNGSRVLLTTTVQEVAEYVDRRGVHQMRFLNKEESWYLLCENVFGGRSCPFHFEQPGKAIAENCEGLPLAIIIVARLLSEAQKTAEYWMKAANRENHVFEDANAEMSRMLFRSYKYLPQNLRTCFLYLASFPVRSEIPASKLINLWSVEGFLEENPFKTLQDVAMECLRGLISRSLVLVSQQTSTSKIKTCRVHSAIWQLCVGEAEKEKFFHVISSYCDSLREGVKGQRRLCIRKNVLFGSEEVQKQMEKVTRAHSLLCTGPHHQYPVPIPSSFGFWMLRVLDALTIHLYKFPIEVLKLVQLKYLSLTCDGKLPPSICELRKLQYLIVRQHLIVKCSRARSYLPMEIWDMQELKHLQIMGADLPNPCGACLPNLTTLSGVSAQSCTKEILEGIPNLKNLGIQIEIESDIVEPLGCFEHLSRLHGLESLKFVMVNPDTSSRSQVVSPPASAKNFPYSLKKLSLSGFGYSWEYMRMIAELPNLEVLKLQCYAFRGPEWVVYGGQFPRLKYLLLDGTDLVHWRAEGYSFPFLERLILRFCYNLEEIPLGMAPTVIELLDCPFAEDSAKEIQVGYGFPQTCFRFSWEDAELIES